jgi:hypothetical protein
MTIIVFKKALPLIMLVPASQIEFMWFSRSLAKIKEILLLAGAQNRAERKFC